MGGAYRCSACTQRHDGDHDCPDEPETDSTPATRRDPIRHRTTLRIPGDLLSPYDDAVERGDYASLSAALRAGLAAGAPALGSEDDQPADPAAARSSGKQAESTEEVADE